MFAEIAMRKAVNAGKPAPEPTPRRKGRRARAAYCADYRCSHSIAISGDQWPDDLRLFGVEDRFTCTACGKRGADVRPNFGWNGQPVAMMGYL